MSIKSIASLLIKIVVGLKIIKLVLQQSDYL